MQLSLALVLTVSKSWSLSWSQRSVSELRRTIRCEQVLPGGCSELVENVVAAAMSEEATDSAGIEWAESLGRMRRAAFGTEREDKPWRDEIAKFEWALELKRRTADMIHEVSELDKQGWTAASYGEIAPGWRFFPLWVAGEFTQRAKESLPLCCQALEAAIAKGLRPHPFQELACGIARLPAGANIVPHCDGGLVSLTAHLGLIVPSQCWLTVSNETRAWQPNEWLAFDASFRHSAVNEASSDRFILLVQPLREALTTPDLEALAHALAVSHPPLGTLHPTLWHNDGRLFSTWRGDLGTDPMPITISEQYDASDLLLVMQPPNDLDLSVSIHNATMYTRPSLDSSQMYDKSLSTCTSQPDLIAVDPRSGALEWLAFARNDTPAGRWLLRQRPESSHEVVPEPDVLAGHLEYLQQHDSCAGWLPYDDVILHTSP